MSEMTMVNFRMDSDLKKEHGKGLQGYGFVHDDRIHDVCNEGQP